MVLSLSLFILCTVIALAVRQLGSNIIDTFLDQCLHGFIMEVMTAGHSLLLANVYYSGELFYNVYSDSREIPSYKK